MKMIEKIMKFINKNIEKISNKLNLDLNYFINNFFWTNIKIITISFLSFLFSLFLIKILNEDDLGRWFWFSSIFAIMSIFTLNGYASVSKNVLINKNYGTYSEIIFNRFISTSIGSLILIILSIYSYFYYNSLSIFFLLLTIFIHLHYLRFYNDYFYSKDNFKKITYIAISENIFFYSISLIVLIISENLLYTILTYYLSQLIINFILTFYVHFKIKKEEDITKKEKSLNLAIKLSFSTIIPIISQNLDKIIIPIFLSLKSLGIYGISLIVPSFLNQIFQRLTLNLLFKKSLNISNKKLKKLFIKLFPVLLISYIFLSVLIYFFIKFLLKYYWEINNSDILLYSIILLIGSFFSICTNIFRETMIANLRIKEFTIIELQINITRVILLIFTIYYFGLIGVIILRTVIEIFRFIIYFFKK